jgi:hypothetical protein
MLRCPVKIAHVVAPLVALAITGAAPAGADTGEQKYLDLLRSQDMTWPPGEAPRW